jgi:ATP-dependent DNA ligase
MELFNSVNKPKEYQDWKNISKYSKFVAEPKYDGYRMLAEKDEFGNITLHRENENIYNESFPEVIKALENMPLNTVYDGELCILDKSHNELHALTSDFSIMQQRGKLKDSFRIKLLSEKSPASFMAFDCMKFNGQDVRSETLTKRREYFKGVNIVQQYDPEELLSQVMKNEMEGIVVKDPNGKYNKECFKFKYYIENDFKIIKVNEKSNPISSLELENQAGESVGAVNYQFNAPQYQTPEIARKLVGMTVCVRHLYKKTGGNLKFPSLQKKDQILRILDQVGQEVLI